MERFLNCHVLVGTRLFLDGPLCAVDSERWTHPLPSQTRREGRQLLETGVVKALKIRDRDPETPHPQIRTGKYFLMIN